MLKTYTLFINGKMRVPFICYTDVAFKTDLAVCTYLFIQHIFVFAIFGHKWRKL